MRARGHRPGGRLGKTFERWKRELLGTGPYWDFSGYGKLDRDESFFLDVPHFTPVVGHVILREILGRDCRLCEARARIIHDAADWVDRSSIDAYLARQAMMRTISRRPHEGCARVVEGVLRARPAASP